GGGGGGGGGGAATVTTGGGGSAGVTDTFAAVWPTRISLPAGSPPWSASRVTSSAVRDPLYEGASALPEAVASSSRIAWPQPGSIRWFGVACTGWPWTTRFVRAVSPKSPSGAGESARAFARAATASAVSSPANSDSFVTSAVAADPLSSAETDAAT